MFSPNHACSQEAGSPAKVFSNRFEMVFVLLVLAIWCWLDVWPRGKLDPSQPQEHRTDFTVYTEAGKAALSGQSPYSVSNARGWTYLYLPLFCLLVSPLSYLSEGLQCVCWFWISIACLHGAFREFNRLNQWAFPESRETASYWKFAPLRRFEQWGGLLCVIGFSLSTLNCLQRGQVGLLQLYLTLLGVRILLTIPTRKNAFIAGGVLAGAIVLKLSPALPTAALLFGLFLNSLRWKSLHWRESVLRPLSMAFGILGGLFVGIWLLPSAVVGWQENESYLQEWRRDVLSRSNHLTKDPFAGDSHSLRNQSPMNGFWLMGNALMRSDGELAMDKPVGKLVLTLVRWSSILMTAIALIAILTRADQKELLIVFAVANAATLLVIPIARGHYFMAMWPATVWVPRWIMLSNPKRLLIPCRLILFMPPLLLVQHYALETQMGALGVLGVGAWLWLGILTATLVAGARAPENVAR